MDTVSLPEEFRKAKNAAFQLLKIRNRSEKEIREKLTRKKYAQDIINQTIQYLKDVSLINDRQFARDWIQTRLNKPLGVRRIFFELKEKGISQETLEEEIKTATASYAEDEVALELGRKRKLKYQNLDEERIKRRVFDYLTRRGFSLESIKKVINKL